MKRTSKKAKGHINNRLNDRNQKIALELFRSDAFLVINKKLLKKLGPIKAIFLENLVDKYKYWKDKDMLNDDSFFLTHEKQIEQTGMNEYQIRECKKYMIELGLLKTSMKGIPAKEHYTLDFERLVDILINDEIPISPALGNSEGKTFNLQKGYTSNSQKGIYKDTIYKDTINNIIGSKNEEETNKPTNKNLEFLPLAIKLADIVQSNKNIKIPQSRVNNWANEIRKLSKIEGVAPARIERALDWYAQNIGGEYIPVIESGSTLRNKFTKLEDAMKRAGISGTSQKNQQEGESPKRLIKEHFNGLAPAFEKDCYLPAKELIPGLKGREERVKLAQNLIELHNKIEDAQERHIPKESQHLFPGAMTIINLYIDWIGNNSWIKDKSINLFSMDHLLFNKFRREEARKDNLERDPVTGKSYMEG